MQANISFPKERIGKMLKPMSRLIAAGALLFVLRATDVPKSYAVAHNTSYAVENSVVNADGGNIPDEEDIPGGRLYRQTASYTPDPRDGFPVTGRMWNIFSGQTDKYGYPISQQYRDELGRDAQLFQKTGIQINSTGKVEYANIFDLLSKEGKDAWLEIALSTPKSFDWSSDSGKPWGHTRYAGLPDTIEENHLIILEQYPELKRAYTSRDDWFEAYGLPMSVADNGNHIAVRGQRAALQLWKEDVPWAKKGQIVLANGGDIAKEAGILPGSRDISKYNPVTWEQATTLIEINGPPEFQQYINDALRLLKTGDGKWYRYVAEVSWGITYDEDWGGYYGVWGPPVNGRMEIKFPAEAIENVMKNHNRNVWPYTRNIGIYTVAEILIHESHHSHRGLAHLPDTEEEAVKEAREAVCEITTTNNNQEAKLFFKCT